MEIGQKIRQIRLSRGLTQSALCGDVITRNMLSLIENGSASPSVRTLLYIAEKLDVPAGYLISDDNIDAESEYLKLHIIGNVRSALKRKDYARCISLCESSIQDFDDEINFILSECYTNLAEEAYKAGYFTSSRENISKAIKNSDATIYNTAEIKHRCSILSELMNDAEGKAPPPVSLFKFNEDDNYLPIKAYIRACDMISNGKIDEAVMLMEECGISEKSGILYDHLKIKMAIANEEYQTSADALTSLLKKNPQSLSAYMQYKIYDDIELCCKQTGDYKSAYEYSTKKLNLMALSKK